MTNRVDQLVADIRSRGARRVLIQMPDGLLAKAPALAEALTAAGIESFIHAKPCYGACDIADDDAKAMGCDLLVHIGHNKFYVDFPSVVPVMYFPWLLDVQLGEIDISSIPVQRLGLVTNIQHITLLGELQKQCEAQGKTAVIGGQILGCWDHNAQKIADKVDAFLYVGSGDFHPLAVTGGKPVYVYDLELGALRKLDTERMEKVRYGRIFKARDAKTFAVLVSTKKGQKELLARAEAVKAYLVSKQRHAFVVVLDAITDARLQALRADAYINTACPRIADDTFSKPFVNAEDVEKIFA